MAPNSHVHYKNAVEVTAAIRGKSLKKAQSYLADVLNHKQAIPFNTFKGGRGRHAQAKGVHAPGSLAGWPVNAVKAVQSLLVNAAANASLKDLDADKLVVHHIAATQALKTRRRTCAWGERCARACSPPP